MKTECKSLECECMGAGHRTAKPKPTIRTLTIVLARMNASRGNHREAARLFASVGIAYCHEIGINEVRS